MIPRIQLLKQSRETEKAVPFTMDSLTSEMTLNYYVTSFLQRIEGD